MANITPVGIDNTTNKLRPYTDGDSLIGAGLNASKLQWVKLPAS